jgi:hypothetical protein
MNNEIFMHFDMHMLTCYPVLSYVIKGQKTEVNTNRFLHLYSLQCGYYYRKSIFKRTPLLAKFYFLMLPM